MEIKQFLLGQLGVERSEQLERRIFADRDFAEEVEIVEGELIADYHDKNLSPEEQALFERQYLASAANAEAVNYEGVFREFISGKLREEDPLHKGQPDLAPAAAEGLQANVSPARTERPKRGARFSRLRGFFTARPAFVNVAVAASLLLLLAVVFWTVTTFLPRPGGGDSAQSERRAIEAELASLNGDPAAASRGRPGAAVDLKPAQRGGGAMSRLRLGDSDLDSFITLRLGLLEAGAGRYRAVFLDDKLDELFAVQDLTAHSTPEGPRVRLIVPAKYFRPGDYQISLSVLNRGGAYEEVNSYTLRVIEAGQ